MPTTGTLTDGTGTLTLAERRAAARKLAEEFDNDTEFQRSLTKRFQTVETNEDAIAKKKDMEQLDNNAPCEPTVDLASKVADLEKAYQRVEKMLSLTNEGRVMQRAIELEVKLENAEEQIANAHDTIRALQAEIKDLKNQGREITNGYDSEEEWDKILSECTTPTMQKYLQHSARARAMAAKRRTTRSATAAVSATSGTSKEVS